MSHKVIKCVYQDKTGCKRIVNSVFTSDSPIQDNKYYAGHNLRLKETGVTAIAKGVMLSE